MAPPGPAPSCPGGCPHAGLSSPDPVTLSERWRRSWLSHVSVPQSLSSDQTGEPREDGLEASLRALGPPYKSPKETGVLKSHDWSEGRPREGTEVSRRKLPLPSAPRHQVPRPPRPGRQPTSPNQRASAGEELPQMRAPSPLDLLGSPSPSPSGCPIKDALCEPELGGTHLSLPICKMRPSQPPPAQAREGRATARRGTSQGLVSRAVSGALSSASGLTHTSPPPGLTVGLRTLQHEECGCEGPGPPRGLGKRARPAR